MGVATILFGLALQHVTPIDVPARPPIPLRETPHVVVVTYPVDGQRASEIQSAIRRQNAEHPNGEWTVANTSWRIEAGWKNDGSRCLPETVTLNWRVETRLPELSPDPRIGVRLRERWRAYLDRIEAFEYGRIQVVNDGMGAIRDAMRAATDCASMLEARRLGEQAIVDAVARYDLATAQSRRALGPFR